MNETTGTRRLTIGIMGWVVKYTVHSHYLEFRAAEVIGDYDPDTKTDCDLFQQADAPHSPAYEKDIDKAEALIGSVKWDGCSNWTNFADQLPGCAKHFCGREDIEAFAAVMLACYDLAKELVPEWSKECGG